MSLRAWGFGFLVCSVVQCFALYPEIAFLAAHAAAVLQLPGKAHNQLEGLASDDKNASKMHSAIDSVYLNLYCHDPPSKPEPSNFVEALGGLVGAAATLVFRDVFRPRLAFRKAIWNTSVSGQACAHVGNRGKQT